MNLIEEDIINDTIVFHYVIPTPAFITTRDALVKRKCLKDFPKKGSFAAHFNSTVHENCPENPKHVRLDLLTGMIIYDAPEINGCRFEFINRNDIKGNIPKSLVNSSALKNTKAMFESLIKVCQQ